MDRQRDSGPGLSDATVLLLERPYRMGGAYRMPPSV